VPLVTEPYSSLEGIFVQRDNVEAVYGQIVSDLNFALAEGGLADAPFPMNGFRVTKGAVATLLADVYLQMAGYPLQSEASYAEAAKTARIVIEGGRHSLIGNGATPAESAFNVMRSSDTEP